MIKIISDRLEIEALEQSNDKLNNQVVCQLAFSKEVFREARQVLIPTSEYSFWAVRVIDKAGNILFYLKYEEDRLITLYESSVVETNYEGEKLTDEVDNLDLSIIEKYNSYIFADLDEYSYAIAELILSQYCDKKIVFFHPMARLFFDDDRVTCINKVDYVSDSNRTMYISSNAVRYDVRPFTDEQVNIFSSITVIANLCWIRKRQNRGELNKDKTIVIIDYSPTLKMGGMGGMKAIINDVLYYSSKVIEKGWIPVVHLTNTQYMSNMIEDSWSYYFKGLSNVSYEEAMQSAHVIDGQENHFTWSPDRILLDAHLENRFDVDFSEQMYKYIDQNMPYHFKENKKILGVIARGSDLKKATKSIFSIDDFIHKTKIRYEGSYDYIFLATEEAEYLKKFQEQFAEKLLYIDQKRVSYDYDNERYKLIADVLSLTDNERTEFGRKYLLITYLLSRCDGVYSTIYSGALQLARHWKRGGRDPFEFDEIYYQYEGNLNAKKYLKRTRIQLRIKEFIEKSEKVIVYGIGRDVKNYVPDVSDDKIIYCDKRAVKNKTVYREHKVIAPDEIEKHGDMPIIVSSTLFGAEIKRELLDKGIDEGRIYLINTFEDSHEGK